MHFIMTHNSYWECGHPALSPQVPWKQDGKHGADWAQLHCPHSKDSQLKQLQMAKKCCLDVSTKFVSCLCVCVGGGGAFV